MVSGGRNSNATPAQSPVVVGNHTSTTKFDKHYMTRLTQIALLLLFFLPVQSVNGQKLKLNNYGIAFCLFEITSTVNNPLTIAEFLKDPVSYKNYLNSLTYNSLYGNPGIQYPKTFYLTTEWKVNTPLSRFWKKHTIQAGLLITNKIRQETGALANQYFTYFPDTVLHEHKYSLQKELQFFGGQLGINRRHNLSKKLDFFSGFHVQGSFALTHYYNQQLDSSTYKPSIGWVRTTNRLPALKGKNFFRWQVMIPFGLEYAIRPQEVFVRMELIVGMVGGKDRPKTFAAREAHGVGVSLTYQPKRKM